MSVYRSYLAGQNEYNRRKRNRRKLRFLLGLILTIVVAGGIYLYREKLDSSFSKDLESVLENYGGSKIEDAVVETFSEKIGNASSDNWFSDSSQAMLSFFNNLISGNFSFGDKKLPIYSVETDEKKIALSFDAAWGAEDFTRIMDILDAHNIKVTFFMTGGWVEQNPDCVKELVNRGHDLGNHSEHHYDMATLSTDEMKDELMAVHEKVFDLTGYEMTLFRPPYGSYNNTLIDTAYDCGYYPIQWSVDSLDWKDYGVSSIIDTVCNHDALGPGAIILCHNGATYTADALDEMITNLENEGYQFVKISDLIMTDDFHMDVTGKQIAD